MKRSKLPNIQINPGKGEFRYGSCASIAICSAFNIQYIPFKVICGLLKIGPVNEGLAFHECRKVINLLGKYYKRPIIYIPNEVNLTYGQLLFVQNRSRFLVVFDEHLSYAEDGAIYDSFILESEGGAAQWLLEIPTGWWRIL